MCLVVFLAFLLLGIFTYNVVVSLIFGLLLIFGIWNCGYHYSKKYTIGNGYIEESSILKRKKLIAYVDISEAEIKQGDNVTYILLFDKRSKRPIIKINMYYENAFLREFDGVVVNCRPQGKKWLVQLDRTAFYPEGGGQPADHGILGGAKVTDVHERDGVILHTCDRALPEGETVHGEIDWARRFDHMQQHSGEHIVSGMLCAAYNCDNTGFHLGEESVIIDYNADIPWEGVLDIEARANRYLWENHPFEALYPSAQELAALPYRSKKELTGQVRITRFPGADCCACCGTHVAYSGQVGLVKFIGWQKFRDGVRLELLCGSRALHYLALNWAQNTAVGRSLSVKPGKTAQAVERLQGELQAVKARCARWERCISPVMCGTHLRNL